MPLREPTPQEIFAQLYSGYRWRNSTVTFSFPTAPNGLYVAGEEAGFTSILGTAQNIARLALSLWDDLIIPNFLEVSPGTSYVSSDLEFGMTTTGDGYAYAYFPSIGSVWFNANYGANSVTNNLVSPTIGRHGFLTYMHEIGHALGLEHAGIYNGSGNWSPLNLHDSAVFSIMSYFGPNWGSGEGQVAWADWIGSNGIRYSPQTPMLDDIFVIQMIYGAETTTRIENTTYGFNSNITGNIGQIYDFTRNSNPILTIYDSAGIDTLDLSGWSTSSIIDIGQGRFSSCNSMTNNIAIAFGCDIENARGGAGNDKIYGNALNNLLYGGSGNDELFGLGGDDTIYGGLGSDTAVFTLTRSSYQITSFQGYLTVQGSSGTTVLYEIEYLRFSDVTVSASSLSQSSDTTAPIVSTFSPSDGATGIALASNVVLTFSETIARGTGTITLRSGSATGTIVESFNAATSNRLTLSDTTLTIDPTRNLSANTQYFVVFTSGNIKDIAGNAYAGISDYDFRTQAPDTTAPTFTSATTSADGLKVILTYNEALGATTAARTAFAVKVAGVTTTVNSVAVNGSTVELTLATSIGAGQSVTVG